MSEREEAALKCAQHIIKIKRTHADYRDSWYGGESNLATEFMLLRQRVQTAERERDEARRERDAERERQTAAWADKANRETTLTHYGLLDEFGHHGCDTLQWVCDALVSERHRAERAERDGALLNFLADDPPFDGFYDMDIYELWGEVAAKYGREEANDDDKREAFRLLLSRALDAHHASEGEG